MTSHSKKLGYFYNKGKDDGLNGTPEYPHDFNPRLPSILPEEPYKIEEITAYLSGYIGALSKKKGHLKEERKKG